MIFVSSALAMVYAINHDPKLANISNFTDKQLKGLYLWESSWEGSPDPQDGKVKLGVQFTPLEEAIRNNNGTVYIRKLQSDLVQLDAMRYFLVPLINILNDSHIFTRI